MLKKNKVLRSFLILAVFLIASSYIGGRIVSDPCSSQQEVQYMPGSRYGIVSPDACQGSLPTLFGWIFVLGVILLIIFFLIIIIKLIRGTLFLTPNS